MERPIVAEMLDLQSRRASDLPAITPRPGRSSPARLGDSLGGERPNKTRKNLDQPEEWLHCHKFRAEMKAACTQQGIDVLEVGPQ